MWYDMGWHGRPGWGWYRHPWGWHGNVALVGGFYGCPYWGWDIHIGILHMAIAPTHGLNTIPAGSRRFIMATSRGIRAAVRIFPARTNSRTANGRLVLERAESCNDSQFGDLRICEFGSDLGAGVSSGLRVAAFPLDSREHGERKADVVDRMLPRADFPQSLR